MNKIFLNFGILFTALIAMAVGIMGAAALITMDTDVASSFSKTKKQEIYNSSNNNTNDELLQLIHNLESSKPASNLFSDYVFPIVSAFFGSLFGGLVAYCIFLRQEKLQIEKNKMDAANQWTLIAEESFTTLLTIKINYQDLLNDNPIQRAMAIPTILLQAQPITTSISNLSFLTPKADDKRNIEKWSQLPRIRTMKANFNLVLSYWQKRNELDRPIKEKVVREFSNGGAATLNAAQLIDCIGGFDLTSLIDLTECTIKLTDDLILEFQDFLLEFPKFAKTQIDENLIKSYGTVMTISLEGNTHIQKLVQRTPKPNFRYIEDLFRATSEEIEKKYETGYETSFKDSLHPTTKSSDD